MKEATGELNMTVITVIAIAAIGGLFYGFVWPMIQKNIVINTCVSVCPSGNIEIVKSTDTTAKGKDKWVCKWDDKEVEMD